ncbi:hypothetical protein [Phaeodactylibacter xiamenensis]|uniref:Uncharacterized protein n=1 Tax=Phaeodactylibacter xiamenensis TaxID=1524460 RepID=A0A098S523_9BACT|nr:hypothetical protein [Phaeodactylibacter xiamenensis]KGE86292.1 hypothetical protein IX84_22300 [Phaeodactylibacter xiamenensis]MCR9052898.1 hypothetical protein [bacterium]
MRIVIKIVLMIAVFMIGIVIMAALKESTGRQSGSGGPLGLVLIFGMIAAFRAIWRYGKEDESKETESSDLQKLDKS